jgi:redox-sensitive bicupin YhaK (pirin superfamily)
MVTRRAVLGGLAVAAAGCDRSWLPRRRLARSVLWVIPGQATSDGAGVKLKRLIGGRALPMLDPFLLLDAFGSDRPEDYVAGFPEHPHRGFETVTIMLEGVMEHRDSVGNRGRLGPGAVQWMTAGRGIVHSEMPGQREGTLSGFQLWVNLPARNKMIAPRYQDLSATDIPSVSVADARARLIAGAVGGRSGPVDGIVTEPTLLDVELEEGGWFEHELPSDHSAFVAVTSGELSIGEPARVARAGEIAVLGAGDKVTVVGQGRFLLAAGAPVREPVARRGPFVMNTESELQQAFDDYRAGRLTGEPYPRAGSGSGAGG